MRGKIELLGDRVLVIADDAVKEQGNIAIPDKGAVKNIRSGIVVNAGPDCKRVKVDQRVVYRLNAGGTPIMLNGKDHLMMSEVLIDFILDSSNEV